VCKFNTPYAEPSHIKLVLNKIGYIFVNEEFINKNIHFDSTTKITNKVKYVIENINDPDVRSKFKPFYEQECIKNYNEITKGLSEKEIDQLKIKYPDIFTLDQVDFRVYVNLKSNKFKKSTQLNDLNESNNDSDDLDDLESINIKQLTETTQTLNLVFTYKYKIESPHLNHSLELFPVKYDDFFSIVARFHLPCVRGYYNGSNVYLSPSCVSAHMTWMNLDYKYISGSKDPFDIINKNRMRGFGIWLNSNEKKLFVKYSREVPFWNNLYMIGTNSSDSEASKHIFGPISLNHKLFRPRLYNMESYVNNMFVDTTNRYNDDAINPIVFDNVNTMTTHIQTKFKSVDIKELNYESFVSIDKDGYIVPVKKWIIGSTWDIYNSQYKKFETKKQVITPETKPIVTKKSVKKQKS
jgi:hypothetical protein